MTNPIFLSAFGSIIGILMVYIHNKITKKENNKKEYIKLLCLLFIVSFIVIQMYIYNSDVLNTIQTDIEVRSGFPDF